MKINVRAFAQKVLPSRFYLFARKVWFQLRILGMRLLGLRSLSPISEDFGEDRGLPIDRYYIEKFLGIHSTDIAGRVLEIGEDLYTKRFGTCEVTKSDVFHVHANNPMATIVGDLADAPHVPSNSFDAIICTQTLHLIYDFQAAVDTLHRLLKPGGVLLCTMPGLTMVHGGEWGSTWYWSFTDLSAKKLFGDCFGEENVKVDVGGNVFVATEFLYGRVTKEMRKSELDTVDRRYPVILAIRARKAALK
jgi:SAM-dependent methyltransferase